MLDTLNLLKSTNTCVLIPTYNNDKTLRRVIVNTLKIIKDPSRLIIINDGSTDQTSAILADFKDQLILLKHSQNQGKGKALLLGLRHAYSLGYMNAITLDSDGQHYPHDIPKFLSVLNEHPNSVIMGARNMNQESVPEASSFGNKFSSFWFKVETGITLPDTQTGFRLYPLKPINEMRFFTSRFEFEIELIVRLAWREIDFQSVQIDVLYDKDERVSHFRPFRDFARISLLNTILFILCLVYVYPKRVFSRKMLSAIKQEAIKSNESNLSKALSLAFGCFIGILPIWGFQLIVGVPLALLFRLNKVLFLAAANISIPPNIPVILYFSMLCGQLLVDGQINHTELVNLNIDTVQNHFYTYVLGACTLSFITFLAVFLISYVTLQKFRPKKSNYK